MKKTIFMLSVIGLFTFCSHNTYNSLQWQSNKVTADGKIPEWENPLRFYDEKSKINYTISNDRNNLYLCMKVSDETEKIKIFRSGLEFKIDTTGEKLFPIAFIFPLANQQIMMQHKKNETQTEENHGEKPDRAAMIKKHLSQAKDIQLIGFKPPLDGVISLAINKTGISAAINIDSLGIMYYEAIIPFSTFYKNELTATDTNRVFNFQITVNAVEGGGGGHSGGGSGGMGGGGGHSGGGGGGMGGGGMGGGGHHGGGGGGYSSGENIAMSETNQIKNKLKLAYK